MPLGSAAPPIAAAVGSGFGVGGFSNFALGVRLREELWRAKVEAAAVRYSENPCTETMAAYRLRARKVRRPCAKPQSREETPKDIKLKPR